MLLLTKYFEFINNGVLKYRFMLVINNEGILIVLLHKVSQRLTVLPQLIRRINNSWNRM